jgi:Mycothiol maleylpyruvate isomerase N-terminal domain
MNRAPVEPVVDAFVHAADWFVALTSIVPTDAWTANGLGEWTVRDLVGHTGRAMSTVAEYASDVVGEPELPGTVDYYRGMVLSGPTAADLNAAVAERGRHAGAELGSDPVHAVTALRDSVVALLRSVDLDSLATSRGGTIRMRDYLPTRTFELTVHSLDLQRAMQRLGVPGIPSAPSGPMADVLRLLVEIAITRGSDFIGELTMVLTGRSALEADYSVL